MSGLLLFGILILSVALTGILTQGNAPWVWILAAVSPFAIPFLYEPDDEETS